MHTNDTEDGLGFWISYFIFITGLTGLLQWAYLHVRFRPNNPMNLPWYLVFLLVIIFSVHYMIIMTGLRQQLAKRSKTGSPPWILTMIVYAIAAIVAVAWVLYMGAEVVYFHNPAGVVAVVFVGFPATVVYFWTNHCQAVADNL